MGLLPCIIQHRFFDIVTSKPATMVRIAIFAALLVGALAAPAADPVPVPTQFTIDNPSIPKVTIDGVTFEADKDVVLTFTGIQLTNNFDTTDKSIVLTNGSVAGFDVTGDGTMDLKLGGNIINKVGYTSATADSFCAIEDTVTIDITTHTADLVITGFKDESTAELFENFVKSNQDQLGHLISNAIMTNYGDDINKYVVAIINSICKF